MGQSFSSKITEFFKADNLVVYIHINSKDIISVDEEAIVLRTTKGENEITKRYPFGRSVGTRGLGDRLINVDGDFSIGIVNLTGGLRGMSEKTYAMIIYGHRETFRILGSKYFIWASEDLRMTKNGYWAVDIPSENSEYYYQ